MPIQMTGGDRRMGYGGASPEDELIELLMRRHSRPQQLGNENFAAQHHPILGDARIMSESDPPPMRTRRPMPPGPAEAETPFEAMVMKLTGRYPGYASERPTPGWEMLEQLRRQQMPPGGTGAPATPSQMPPEPQPHPIFQPRRHPLLEAMNQY